MDHITEFRLTDTVWGTVLFLRPVPRDGDFWGVLAPLRDTVWGDQLAIIPESIFEQALLGHIMPMMRIIGPEPRSLCKQIPREEGACRYLLDKSCIIGSPKCLPGKKLPECYEPPELEGDANFAARTVALAWKEGRYVILVQPE